MPETDTQFKIVLEDEVDGDAELKFSIPGTIPTDEEQPQVLVDYEVGNSLVVLADMIQVNHGTLVEGGSPATLIVMRFEFQPLGNYRRFKSVNAKMTFSKGANSTTAPEVLNITPKGVWSILPSNIPEETSHSISPSIEGGGGPLNVKAAYTWQFKKTVDKENSAKITGIIRALGSDRSKKNTAIWTLSENPDTNSGIPTLLQTAILLKRSRMDGNVKGEKFKAELEIHGEVDKVTQWSERWKRVAATVRGRAEKTEAITFSPGVNRGSVQDPDNLGNEELEKFRKAVTLQPWKDGNTIPAAEKAKEEADGKKSQDDTLQGDEIYIGDSEMVESQ